MKTTPKNQTRRFRRPHRNGDLSEHKHPRTCVQLPREVANRGKELAASQGKSFVGLLVEMIERKARTGQEGR